MLKFIRGKYQPSAERLKLQKELFKFTKGLHHGFPSKPSAVGWEPELRLIAIGTRSGAIKLYGALGVEFYGQHENSESAVTSIYFLPNQGRLITLCDDNSLHLWELNEHDDDKWALDEIKSVQLEGKLKKISTCCLMDTATELLIGTEGGNIYLLDIKTFETSDTIIYQDVVMQNVPDDYKVNPGPVEAIAQQPTDPTKIIIGYERGLLVLWDRVKLHADQTYVSNQQLESVCWLRGGKEFISSHNDGSYIKWSATTSQSSSPPETPYGPFPCKPMTKIVSKSSKNGDYIIFGGGMPRVQYMDKNCVTITRGDTSVAFDFTSKIIDLFVICEDSSDSEYDSPTAVVVLVEEELVVIDLVTEGWPTFSNPYLASLHSSAITCAYLSSDVPRELFQKIQTIGKSQCTSSSQPWPIDGGTTKYEDDESLPRNVLLTGHEDGSVRFWDASGPALSLMYTLKTGPLYEAEPQQEEEDWPPFRKIGCFDPYSDDPRLAVKKISLCPLSGTLLIAGTAGQLILTHINTEEAEKELEVHTINIVSDRDNFVWKGHEQLNLRNPAAENEDGEREDVEKEGVSSFKFASGFQPSMIIQILPPAAVTAVCLHPEWGLIAAGTAHGLGLFDYVQKKTVLVKCTLNPNDMTADGSNYSRRKSLKKSLRESFRRLRKGRSQRNLERKKQAAEANKGASSEEIKEEKIEEVNEAPKAEEEELEDDNTTTEPESEKKEPEKPASKETSTPEKEKTPSPEKASTSEKAASPEKEKASPEKEKTSSKQGSPTPTSPRTVDVKPVERQVEARTPDDAMGSMVRCVYLAESFVVTAHSTTATLWAGTNSGAIYIYTIQLPKDDKRKEDPVSCSLGKEIQLKHRAPVISVHIIDGSHRPLPDPLQVHMGVAEPSNNSSPHHLLICSEEQFKIFTLPNLKPYHKFKLTAMEGSRVRRVGLVKFTSCANSDYSEYCVACMSNQGEVVVLSLPDLRKQISAEVTRRDDINGIGSLVFNNVGEALYLHSPSELQRISLSTTVQTRPVCSVHLPEGARPEKKTEKTEPAAAEEAEEPAATEPTVNGETSVDETTEENKGEITNPDITLDSIKDHINNLNMNDSSLITSSEVTKEVKSEKIEESTTIVKTTTILTTEAIPATNEDKGNDENILNTNHIEPRPFYAPLASVEDTENL